jgi:hypothetical protein
LLEFPLDELDRVAIGISDPGGSELAVEEVMGRRKDRRTFFDEGA